MPPVWSRPRAQRLYAQRKAQHRCPTCTAAAAPGHVYCADCLATMRVAAKRAYWATQRHAPLLCYCGAWSPVQALPHRCPQCGRVYFSEADIAQVTRRNGA